MATTSTDAAFAARVRNLARAGNVSRDVAAAVLRKVAAELVPDVDADALLRREVEFWAEQLRAEGHNVTPDSLVGTAGAARLLDCHEVTLRKHRQDPGAPPLHDMLNGRARYSLPALLAYRRERQRSAA